MSQKCGVKLIQAPYICAHEAMEPDGRCCSACSSTGGHTPECYIRTYPGSPNAEYMGLSADDMMASLLTRLDRALIGARMVEREVDTIRRIIWDMNMGHSHTSLQSLLYHLEIDLRYIANEIKGITGKK